MYRVKVFPKACCRLEVDEFGASYAVLQQFLRGKCMLPHVCIECMDEAV